MGLTKSLLQRGGGFAEGEDGGSSPLKREDDILPYGYKPMCIAPRAPTKTKPPVDAKRLCCLVLGGLFYNITVKALFIKRFDFFFKGFDIAFKHYHRVISLVEIHKG